MHGLVVPMLGDQLITLVTGFALTTVVGGGLGFLFQRRAWEHQHRVLLEEQERERAARVFEEFSRLLDKRLYRMRQVHRAFARQLDRGENLSPAGRLPGTQLMRLRLTYRALVRLFSRGEESSGAADEWADYRSVVREWNDSVNRNLALIQQYFGMGMRNGFDYDIGAQLVDVGRQLEAIYTGRASLANPELRHLELRLDEAGSHIYQFNLEMIRALQTGKVGWLVPENRAGR
jgi:hypothetical protein